MSANLTMSERMKQFWAKVPPVERAKRMSALGKKSRQGKWAALTPKERMAIIQKMVQARKDKYAKATKK